MNAPVATPSRLDIRTVRKIKLSADRSDLPDDATDHHAIELPDFGLIYPNIGPIEADDFEHGIRLGSEYRLFDQPCVTPEVEELNLVVDRRFYRPAVDKSFFPKISTADWYWSATKDASSPSGCAWFVNFSHGYVDYNYQGYGGCVLPVLRVSPRQS